MARTTARRRQRGAVLASQLLYPAADVTPVAIDLEDRLGSRLGIRYRPQNRKEKKAQPIPRTLCFCGTEAARFSAHWRGQHHRVDCCLLLMEERFGFVPDPQALRIITYSGGWPITQSYASQILQLQAMADRLRRV